MKTTTKTLTTIGTAVASTFAANAVNAENNPFAMTDLDNGYMQLAQTDKAGEMKCGSKMDKKKDAACGEGRCGNMMEDGKMKKGLENSCGAMMKGKEGACGDMKGKTTGQKVKNKGYSVNTSGWGNKKSKKSAPDNMKGMDMGKGMEGKCGEGMCGGMMQGGKMKKGMEGMCGGMMKGKEGACGMGMMGGGMKGMDDMKGMGNMKGMQGGGNMQGGQGKQGGNMQGMGGMKGGMGGMKGEEASCGAMISPEKASGK